MDYGLGNLFSVERACESAGLEGVITCDPDMLRRSDAVILPGVGAFSTAMLSLDRTGLSDAIRDFVATGRPFVGVCLGIQLLMAESTEFGTHRGLGILDGSVVRLRPVLDSDEPLKVPHMQWNRILEIAPRRWQGTLLSGLSGGDFMYFVHSYYVIPSDPQVVAATTRYANTEFCSVVQKDNVFACQFHPERSGRLGLRIYANLARMLRTDKTNRSTLEGVST